MPDISLIICTYNRCKSLRRTLDTCCALIAPAEGGWELLVVDNNSKDATRDTCVEFERRLPLRYIFEPRQGKSCALNRAMAEAKGRLLVFTDDDVDVEPEWLANLAGAAERHPEVTIFGGKVMPRWERTPPRWILETRLKMLDFVFVRYDLGDAERPLSSDEHSFLGANLALRAEILKAGYRFDERLGPQGRQAIHGEESALQHDLTNSRARSLYVPSALVHHRNPPERMTEGYFRHYHRGMGARQARLALAAGERVWSGESLRLFAKMFWHAAHYCAARPFAHCDKWLIRERAMAICLGNLCERVRYAVRKR